MAFAPVPCGPFGPAGDIAAAAFFRRLPADKLPTRIGTVEAIDLMGRPPTYTVDGRRMRFLHASDPGGLVTVGTRVMWIVCGDAPYILGTLENTPPPAQTTDVCFYTNQAVNSFYPAVRFRIWQGTADTAGKASWSTDVVAANVMMCHATAHEYTVGFSVQSRRPSVVKADGTIEITGMNPGRRFHVVVIEECATAPATYRFVATGDNTAADENGYGHPLWSIRLQTGTLDGNGHRAAAGFPNDDPNNVLAVAGRVMIDGDSHDLGFFSRVNEQDNNPVRLHASGEVSGDGTAIANMDYRIMWFQRPADPYTSAANDLVAPYLGADKIGEYPQFQIIEFDASFPAGNTYGGRAYKTAGIPTIAHRNVGVLAFEPTSFRSLAAEFHSESRDVYELADPRRAGSLAGTTGKALAFVLAGADTAQPVN